MGIDTVIAEVLPRDKAAKITELQRAGNRVAMVGDGVNDAPALAQADLEVATGAGTDVAIETADVVLVRSDPLDVPIALRIGKGTLRKMRQNLGWAIGYNAVALPIAAGVFAPAFGLVLRPEIAALSMWGWSLIVAVNALLLKWLRLPEPSADLGADAPDGQAGSSVVTERRGQRRPRPRPPGWPGADMRSTRYGKVGRVKRHLIAAGALILTLVGCSTTAPETDQASPSAPTVTTDKAAFLVEHDLEGMDGTQIIDHLDQVPLAQRSTDLMASVRADHLLLADAEQEFTIPIPEDRFYLAVAPYVDHTHECYYHSLTTCRGELADEELQIRVVDDATGEVLVDEQVTTFDNGFVGFWLPRGVNGTIEAIYKGRTGRSAFSTTDEGATCLTTLQLTQA